MRSRLKTVDLNGHAVAEFVKARCLAVEPELRRLAEVQRLNSEDIAPKLGLTSATVFKYCKFLGVDIVRKKHPAKNYTKGQKESWAGQIRTLRKAGLSYAEIANRIGCTRIMANRIALDMELGVREWRR